MQTFVIGTAGHIDHGKTALVKALTGTDTDRLQEEQARGITIDLGFAFLQLDDDLRASIVDVPGHERFVKNMVAGTGGIDMVLLCVAADEGVMPQTREHLDICKLLGVKRGVVALTKYDMVESEWIELVREDLGNELEGSFLEDSPVVRVSSKTGQGLDELKDVLRQQARGIEQHPSDGLTFLAVDRAFSMHGFGSVVTGTLVSGRLRLDDEVDLLPDPAAHLRSLKVRGLQSHGQDLQEALPGQRLAVNLAGTERQLLQRGQVLVQAGSLDPSSLLECTLQLLDGARPLKTRSELLFHSGTSRTSASLQLASPDKVLSSGETGYVRVRLAEPLAVLPGQHYILRGFNAIPGRGTTLAGGRILLNFPPARRGRDRAQWRAELERLASGSLPERLEAVLLHARADGLDLRELAMRCGASARAVERALTPLLQSRQVYKFDRERGRYLSADVLDALVQRSIELLSDYHRSNPLRPGMPSEQLRSSLIPNPSPRLFRLLLGELARREAAVQAGEVTRLCAHRVQLDEDRTSDEAAIGALYEQAALTPPRLAEVVAKLDRPQAAVKELIEFMVRSGALVHVSGDMYVSSQAVEELERRLVEYLEKHESISTQTFKGMVGASRKHVIPLAEYFDRRKVTMRVGEQRVLRRRKATPSPAGERSS
ncbi:MAG: selenocysteine-specific translation elongation factor [Deltaproteobacteria bacterium]|nr:selenocysteine-specific translation elongation factor [Deltaproteobacteria bacterium]